MGIANENPPRRLRADDYTLETVDASRFILDERPDLVRARLIALAEETSRQIRAGPATALSWQALFLWRQGGRSLDGGHGHGVRSFGRWVGCGDGDTGRHPRTGY